MTTMWRTGSRACGTARWMPRVRWSRAPASAPARPRTSSTHGPAAFTTIRLRARMLWPASVSRSATSPPAISVASTWFTHSAPAACAPSTVSSTRRASSVRYSTKVAAPWRRVPSSVGSRARASSRLHIACRSSGATVAMRSKVQRPRPSFACPARLGGERRGHRGRWLARRAQLGEGRLRLGDLVGAALLARDLERARREDERLLPVAARLAHVGERQARGERVRVAREDLAQHRLAPRAVPAEQARETDEERALRGHRIDVVRVQLERTVDLRHQAAELEDLGEILAVEAHQLAQVAEEGEVRVGVVVVECDGALGERLAAVEVLLACLPIGRTAAGVALGARAGGEARDRVVGGAHGGRQAEADECHEHPP